MHPDYNCPHTAFKKRCSKLRESCPKWVHLIGLDPNTGQPVDIFDCKDRWDSRMQMEIAKEVRQSAAATESFRNMILELQKGVSPQAIEDRVKMKAIENGR